MKLSAIIRAIVRPYIEVESKDRSLVVRSRGFAGPGIGMAASLYAFPLRATEFRIGGLTVAYWGRDTLVHPTEAS